jgi:hypothetical protein
LAALARWLTPTEWWPREWIYSLFVWPFSMATGMTLFVIFNGWLRGRLDH